MMMLLLTFLALPVARSLVVQHVQRLVEESGVIQNDVGAASGEGKPEGRQESEACLRGEKWPTVVCRKTYQRSCLKASYRPFTGVSVTRFDACQKCCMKFWMERLDRKSHLKLFTGEVAAGAASNKLSGILRPAEYHGQGVFDDASYWYIRAFELADVVIGSSLSASTGEAVAEKAVPLSDSEIRALKPGALIWLGDTHEARDAFFKGTLPRLRSPVAVGVAGDENEPLGGGPGCQSASTVNRPMDLDGDIRVACPEPNHTAFLDDPNILAFYTMNPSIVHPKVKPYAIGIKSPRVIRTVSFQEEELGYRRTQRTRLLHCNGLLAEPYKNPWRVEQRKRVVGNLTANGFDCTSERLSPPNWTQSLFAAKFVAAPRGMGRADFRLWEALSAGAVPVVERDPVLAADVYKGLPIVQVASWSKVTKEFLDAQWREIQQKAAAGSYDEGMAKVHWPYWMERITHTVSQELQ